MATLKEKSRGEWTREEDGSERAVIVFEVRCTSDTESIQSIESSTGYPVQGEPHPERSAAKLKTLALKEVDEFHDLRELTCTYSTKQEQQNDQKNPLIARVKGGMRSVSIDVPAYYDAFGNPLTNSAGDLIEGLTKKARRRQVFVTYNAATIPDLLFELSDTINSAAVTILGRTYPAGTCYLSNVFFPDEPETTPDGQEYYPITYDIDIALDGWYSIYPDKGKHELIYQTRSGPSAEWVDGTKATYDAKSPTTDRQVVKRKIQTTEQQDVASDIWLDYNGQATRVLSLNTVAFTSGAMTAGSATLTVASGLVEETHKGCLVIVPGAGPFGRKLEATITAVASGTSCTLSRVASTTVSGKSVYIPGARFRYYLLPDVASWAGLPLPNNQP